MESVVESSWEMGELKILLFRLLNSRCGTKAIKYRSERSRDKEGQERKGEEVLQIYKYKT
jgi:hypothetical protein